MALSETLDLEAVQVTRDYLHALDELSFADNPIYKAVHQMLGHSPVVAEASVHGYRGLGHDGGRTDSREPPATLKPEACIISIYTTPEGPRHMGQVDFATPNQNVAVELMEQLAGGNAPWLLYHSGRSFHGYIRMGMHTEPGFRIFMARLLLANKMPQYPVVDTRWVGHRLIQGYSALRITRYDEEHYLKVPELVARCDP